MNCETVDTPQLLIPNSKPLTLYDMEASYFLEVTKKYLSEENLTLFKIVSDHLDNTILKKDFVKKLIFDKFESINQYV
jgi:hypothetical protein